MRFIGQGRKRFVAAGVAMMFAAGIGMAVASSGPSSNAMSMGHGVNEFGLTKAYLNGQTTEFTYSKGFYCDTSRKSAASSGCEAGAGARKPPAKNFDTLYVTVPLGFTIPKMKMQCPTGLVCVDHPGTMDLTRLEPALKPLYPSLTKKQLTDALKNYQTPGHQHFIDNLNGQRPEWWDVKVVGVTSKAEYDKIDRHKSLAYLRHQVKQGKTTAVIPTNLFLYFGVKK